MDQKINETDRGYSNSNIDTHKLSSDLEDERAINGSCMTFEGGIRPADELDAEDVQQMEFGSVEDVARVATLESSERMAVILRVKIKILYEKPFQRKFPGNR